MGPHRGAFQQLPQQGIKLFSVGGKIYRGYKRERDSNGTPQGYHCVRYTLRGIKLISVGGKKNQNIKQKDTQRGPLGDHLKDDPASGGKFLCCTILLKYQIQRHILEVIPQQMEYPETPEFFQGLCLFFISLFFTLLLVVISPLATISILKFNSRMQERNQHYIYQMPSIPDGSLYDKFWA